MVEVPGMLGYEYPYWYVMVLGWPADVAGRMGVGIGAGGG